MATNKKSPKGLSRSFSLASKKVQLFVFVGIFAVLGGAYFLYQSHADASLRLSGCTVSGNIGQNGHPKYAINSWAPDGKGGVRLTGQDTTIPNTGAFSFTLRSAKSGTKSEVILYRNQVRWKSLGYVRNTSNCL